MSDAVLRPSLGARERKKENVKDGYRFVDCDMHIMEPTDLFDEYLDPAFKQRVDFVARARPIPEVRACVADRCGNTSVMFASERGYVAELLNRDREHPCRPVSASRFSFPEVSTRVLNNSLARGKILYGGARLYGFTQADFEKADIAAKRRDNLHAAQA